MLALGDVRVATGYDVHALGPGVAIMLGGISIPYSRGVVAHSDGDVALHALTDAILGTIADGDIGVHFPPSDEKWRGASSDAFLADAARRLKARGGRIAHLDLALVAEAPKVGPHREAMRDPHRRNLRHSGWPSFGQGDDQRGPRLHRPRRRHCRFRDGDGPPALCGDAMTDLSPLLPLAKDIIETGTSHGLKVATAESCTGGLIAGVLTEIAGSSAVVDRGFVTYSNSAKTDMLGVPADLIARVGAVSEEVARAMAEGALAHSRADIVVAVTGVAGPTGGTPEKPVGMVHFAAGRKGSPVAHAVHVFEDFGRSSIRLATVREALTMIRSLM